MYAIAINGSPRQNGNTKQLLQTVLTPLQAAGWETELYQLGGKTIRGCIACFQCWEKSDKQCAVKNDCFNEVFEKMIRADAIIIGSPTYYSGMSAETKALIDRAGFVARANNDLFKGKVGAAVAAVRRAGAVHVVEGIMRMYLISHMVILGSSYWNIGVGMESGEVKDDTEGMENMANLGKTIALVAKLLAPHVSNWPV